MKRVELLETNNTPHIVMDPISNTITLEGKSFPEDSKDFYKTVLEWLNDYISSKPTSLSVTFNLFYLSSSSIISVKQILMKVADLANGGTKTKVVWCYDEDDDDIRKTGEDYARITKLDFEFKANE